MATERTLSATPIKNGIGRKKVGMVMAFTGHYNSAKLIGRFLELAGIDVVRSRVTTPKIIEAGTTFTSADFCIPLRVYVGHIYHLIAANPDMEFIVAPNILSEDGKSATCSKYRDIGGVAIRSLGDSIGYLLHHSKEETVMRIANLIGNEEVLQRAEKARTLPTFIMPNIRSLERKDMFNTCYNVYADIMGWDKSRKACLFLTGSARKRVAPWMAHLEEVFEKAYQEIVETQPTRLAQLLRDERKPRLAVVGRRYLVNDAALTCDLKLWFQKKGVSVITATDVPREVISPLYDRAEGFYDTHKEGKAFIDWATDKVDGFISVGSFGCHPDAFQVDYLAEYARSKGMPCWTFRYDESAGSAGFHTRYETILAFLEQRCEQRLQGINSEGLPADQHTAAARPTVAVKPKKPLIIWPYMGEIVNLLIEEACYQLGLESYMHPPLPISEETIALGNTNYTESCSPYACSTGSLKQSLRDALRGLEEEARQKGVPVEPRRIIIIMARGEGPCTFGWYAIVQNKHLPEEFAPELERYGHTIEMATMGLDGFVDFIKDLCEIGDARKLRPILEYVKAYEKGLDNLPRLKRTALQFGLMKAINHLTRPLWAKLDAAEAIRAKALILRAHELEHGSITRAYRKAIELLRRAHSVEEIKRAEKEALDLLEAVPHDSRIKPRVVSVGEIYVALTSFGNRGTIENLLGREGIEVVEGITLGGFIRHSLHEMKRRSRRRHPLIRPLLDYLKEHNVPLMEQQIRVPEARPFIVHEVGGDGLPSVGHARHYIEEGCDGIIHIFPFKCMPEGIAKDAIKELADLYGVRYLSLSFDKETEIERLRTEISTFAALLQAQVSQQGADDTESYWERKRAEVTRRQAIGRGLNAMYETYRRPRHVD